MKGAPVHGVLQSPGETKKESAQRGSHTQGVKVHTEKGGHPQGKAAGRVLTLRVRGGLGQQSAARR